MEIILDTEHLLFKCDKTRHILKEGKMKNLGIIFFFHMFQLTASKIETYRAKKSTVQKTFEAYCKLEKSCSIYNTDYIANKSQSNFNSVESFNHRHQSNVKVECTVFTVLLIPLFYSPTPKCNSSDTECI